jgi:hypothetical protein
MRKLLLALTLFIYTSIAAFSQETEPEEVKIANPLLVDGKLLIDSFFANKSEKLIYTGVLKFDSLTQKQLISKVKNWASTKFVSLKQILVSETEDQIVLNYIDGSFYSKSLGIKSYFEYYIRLVIQFKEGKIKCSYYDDGNVAVLPSKYQSFIEARTIFIPENFKEKKGLIVAKSNNVDGLLALKESIIRNFNSIKVDIDKKEINKDW